MDLSQVACSEVTIVRADGTTETRPAYTPSELHTILNARRRANRRRDSVLRGAQAGGAARRERVRS